MRTLFVFACLIFLGGSFAIGWYHGKSASANVEKDSVIVDCGSHDDSYIEQVQLLSLDKRWSKAQLDSLNRLALNLYTSLCSEVLWHRVCALKNVDPYPSPALCKGFYAHYIQDCLKDCDDSTYQHILQAFEDWRMSVKACYPINASSKVGLPYNEDSIELVTLQYFCGLLAGDYTYSYWYGFCDYTNQLMDPDKRLSFKDVSKTCLDNETAAWDRLVMLVEQYRNKQLVDYVSHKRSTKGATDQQVINDRLVWQPYWG